MLSDLMEFLLNETAAKTFTITDDLDREASYSDKQLHQIRATPQPQKPQIQVCTLVGLNDLIAGKLEAIDFQGCFLIHVEDEKTVRLIERLSDDHGQRNCLVVARPVEFTKFNFGAFIPQEEFILKVSSLFADGGDKEYVLNVAGSLTTEGTNVSTDDGFSQKVILQAGLSHKKEVTLKKKVSLAPYRTFPEVSQPMSDFVLRARTGESGPSLCLIEADGGKWKLDAIGTIREYMGSFDLGIPIIA